MPVRPNACSGLSVPGPAPAQVLGQVGVRHRRFQRGDHASQVAVAVCIERALVEGGNRPGAHALQDILHHAVQAQLHAVLGAVDALYPVGLQLRGLRGAEGDVGLLRSAHCGAAAAVAVRGDALRLDQFRLEIIAGAQILIIIIGDRQKLHARGPMGLVEMTSTKYVVRGKGHIRGKIGEITK